ncbi:MAG: lipocalin family protein [Psychroserpens sp.]|nr:lipocalin family protein [Psychroserpens sp.]
MKKIFTISLIFLILVGCGSTKDLNGIPGKKTLKGEWQVDDIEFFGAEGTYKAYLFDIADSYCFKNSVWMFIPNNYTGKFTLTSNSSNCESTTARIRWSYYDSDEGRSIQFKYTDNKNKSIDPNNRGYRMKVKSLNQTNMKIEMDLEQQGSPFSVVMSFTKISNNVVL